MVTVVSHDAARAARIQELKDLLARRVVVLDGAYGTMLQGVGLTPADYRHGGFVPADHPRDVTGDPDLLNLTRPDVIRDVHHQYLVAGADVITTNTFTATSIGQGDYGLQPLVREMNLRGAKLARQAVVGLADAGRGERVGGGDVRTRGQILPVHVAHHVGPGQVEQVRVAGHIPRVITQRAVAVVIRAEADRLEHRPPGAVEHGDALIQQFAEGLIRRG